MLKPGNPVPDFACEAFLPDGEFAPLSLADLRGKWVTLFFWPLDFTFVCPTEIRAFNEIAAEFHRHDCVLLGASVDSVHVHRAWTQHGLGKMAFPMIGDVAHRLADGFGVLNDEGVALRATFIINPQGVIESVTANALNAGRSARETLRTLLALQSGELTGCEWQPGDAFVKAA